MAPKLTKRERKGNQWANLQDALCKYSKCLFVDVDNVTSKQICVMRREFRRLNALMIMGKNVSQTNTPTNQSIVIDPHEGCYR